MNTIEVPAVIFTIVKLLVLFGILLYSIFAAIIVRQEQLMANVLEESFEPVLRMITIVHLVAAIAVFAIALLLL